MDSLTENFMNRIQVCLPCKVLNVSSNSLLQVDPLIFNELELPVINEVPVYHLGNINANIKVKVNVGDHGLVLFSQVDFANYMVSGNKSSGVTSEPFNLTNCIYLPMAAWRGGGLAMPSFDFEINGNILINGNITHNGNTTHTGQLINSGKVESNGIVLDTHVHGGILPGGALTSEPV